MHPKGKMATVQKWWIKKSHLSFSAPPSLTVWEKEVWLLQNFTIHSKVFSSIKQTSFSTCTSKQISKTGFEHKEKGWLP